MFVIRNGIDVRASTCLNKISNEEEIQVGIVGNMTRAVKRFDLFIKAAGIISQNYPNITWKVVGDGHLRKDLEVLAVEVGLRDKVIFTGRVEDTKSELEEMDIGVLCSDSEGLSNALLEYMINGVAVVATDVGGNPEVVRHMETGILVKPDSVEALSDGITKLLLDEVLRNKLVTNASEMIQNEYGWERCTAEYLKLHSECLNR